MTLIDNAFFTFLTNVIAASQDGSADSVGKIMTDSLKRASLLRPEGCLNPGDAA